MIRPSTPHPTSQDLLLYIHTLPFSTSPDLAFRSPPFPSGPAPVHPEHPGGGGPAPSTRAAVHGQGRGRQAEGCNRNPGGMEGAAGQEAAQQVRAGCRGGIEHRGHRQMKWLVPPTMSPTCLPGRVLRRPPSRAPGGPTASGCSSRRGSSGPGRQVGGVGEKCRSQPYSASTLML